MGDREKEKGKEVGEKRGSPMTITAGQYFMKMKCYGTVYSGRGAEEEEEEEEANGCEALITASFSPPHWRRHHRWRVRERNGSGDWRAPVSLASCH